MKKIALLALLLSSPLHAATFAELSAGKEEIMAEVANSTESRSKGLMGRKHLEENRGMIFVFPQADYYGMWMENTPVALSVAFLDEKGVIINIEDMSPLTEITHMSKGKSKYALEMNRGWFSSHRVKEGDRIADVEKLPSASN